MTGTVFTIGHSNRKITDFLALLRDHEIKCLVDVRRYPGSQRNPQFNQRNLESYLLREHVDYVMLGDSLGGKRGIEYTEYMDSTDFKGGLNMLCKYASEFVTAFMCAERLHTFCHRKYIADALIEQNWKVFHIIDAGRTHGHQFRLL